MNYYIYFSRVLRYVASWLQERLLDHRNMDTTRGAVYRFLVYSVLYKYSRKIGRVGKRKYVSSYSPGSMSWEMDEQLFRKLVLYVEGYLADIAYRVSDAPKTMPPDRETRVKWGRAALNHMKTPPDPKKHVKTPDELSERRKKRLKDWKEIARIYNWYTKERENWTDPYIDEVEVRFSEDSGLPDLSDEDMEYAGMSRKYEDIWHQRRKGRAKRLFDRRYILTYD